MNIMTAFKTRNLEVSNKLPKATWHMVKGFATNFEPSLDGWRFPTRRELLSIANGVPDSDTYWSSSEHHDPELAWAVDMLNQYDHLAYKGYSHYTRLVRDRRDVESN
jgi:hypothetical protein